MAKARWGHFAFLNKRRALADAYMRGVSQLSEPPISLTAETTTRCPLSCPMCLRRVDHVPPMDMEVEVFQRIWADGDDVCELAYLYGLGEPLCDGEIWKKVQYAHQRGVIVQLSTNAVLLSEEHDQLLLEARPECVIFSVDAADKLLYEQIRKGAQFETVYENIRRFLEKNRTAGNPIFTIIQMVVTDKNRHHVREFQQFWKAMRPGAIRIKVDEVKGQKHRQALMARRRCPVLWQGPLFVRADGSVLPCCHMIGEQPLGNIKEQGVRQLWNHHKLVELRHLHATQGAGSVHPCRRCHFPLLPTWMVFPWFFPRGLAWTRMLPLLERTYYRLFF